MNASFRSGARIFPILALVSLATALAWNKLEAPATGIDDANIFLVYARNVSAGEGFVFNPGSERVEGFTSLLWVVLAAGASAAFGEPERALLVANVLLLSATVLACIRALPAGWAIAFVMLVLGNISFIVWHTITLMESALWGALLTTGVLVSAENGRDRRRSILLSTLVALLILTRPEALVWAPVLLCIRFWRRLEGANHSAAVRHVIPAAVVLVSTAGLLTAFRVAYFGFPLPNTYYAKVSPSLAYRLGEGATYLGSFIVSSPIALAATLAVLASTAHLLNDRFRDTRTLALTLASACGLLVPVLTGGDHFDGFRFYQPIYPLLVLTLFNFIRTVMPRYVPAAGVRMTDRSRLVAAAASLGVAVVLQSVDWIASDRSTLLGREFDIAAAGRQIGQRANVVFRSLDPLPGVATITVGGLKYGYQGPVIDLMGLNLTAMAHNGGDRIGVRSHAAFEPQTFFELRPAIVLPLVQFNESLAEVGRRDLFADRVLKGLFDEPQFRERYQLAEVRKTTRKGVVAVAAWYERDFLAELRRNGALHVSVATRDYR